MARGHGQGFLARLFIAIARQLLDHQGDFAGDRIGQPVGHGVPVPVIEDEGGDGLGQYHGRHHDQHGAREQRGRHHPFQPTQGPGTVFPQGLQPAGQSGLNT
jgi:hypothetical protein